MDYDDERIYYTRQNLFPQGAPPGGEPLDSSSVATLENDRVDLNVCQRHFREFLRNYRSNVRYVYRDRLLRMNQRGGNFIDVDLSHVAEYDPHLLDLLLTSPNQTLTAFEKAAVDALQMLLQENIGEVGVENIDVPESSRQSLGIQLLFKGNLAATPLRAIQSHHINTLIRCPGIVISSSRLRPKATSLTVRCTR